MAPMKRSRDSGAKGRDKPKRRRRVEGADPLFKFLGKLCGEECDEELVPVNGASSVGRSARKELRKAGRDTQTGRQQQQQPDSDEMEDRELDAIMMDMSDEDYEPPTRGGRDSKTGHGSSSSGRVAKQRQHKRLAGAGTGQTSTPETVTLSQGVQKAKRYICEALDFGVTSGYLTPKDAKGRILQVSPELLNTTSGGASGAAGGSGAGSAGKSNAQTRRRKAAEEMDEEFDDEGEEEKSKKHKGSKKHRSRSSKGGGGKKSGKSRSRSRSKRRSGKHGKKRIASRQQPESEPNPNGHENEAEQDEMDDQVNTNTKTGQSSSSGGIGSNGNNSGSGANKNDNEDDDNKSIRSTKSVKSTPNSESQRTNDDSKKHHGDDDDNSNYDDDDDDESENKKGC